MTDLLTTSCDVCGEIKKETNDWLRAVVTGNGLMFVPTAEPKTSKFDKVSSEDICGADCAQKRLSQWLTQQGI